MKKKTIITIVIIFILLTGIIASMLIVNPINSNAKSVSIQKYIYNPVNIIDNKIETEDAHILPFILEESYEGLYQEDLEEEFKKANLTIDTISSDLLGTETVIKTVEETKPYKILIYGDVDSDGQITLEDAQRIIEYCLYADEDAAYNLTELCYEAGNVSNYDGDEEVDLMDAQEIIDFCLGNVDCILTEPPVDDTISSLELTAPNKIIYNFGEKLDLTGAQVRAITKSGVKCVPESISEEIISGYDSEKEGTQDVTVKYAGITNTFKVTVLKPITTLSIDESIKSKDSSIGKETILGTIAQGEGQSNLNKDNLKTNVVLEDGTEASEKVEVTYKLRNEVFTDCTDENKNDIVVVAVMKEAGKYKVTSYLGENLENSTAKSNTITIEATDTVSIGKLEIDSPLPIICGGSIEDADLPEGALVRTETKDVMGTTETVNYVLMPIKFKDQHGNYQDLDASDYLGYESSKAYKITVSDDYGYSIPAVEVKLFRVNTDGEIVPAGGENTFDYMGFAPVHNVTPDMLEGGHITITYGEANTVNAVQATLEVKVIK